MSIITRKKHITYVLILAGILSACNLTSVPATPTTLDVTIPRVNLTRTIINTPIPTQKAIPTISATPRLTSHTTITPTLLTNNNCPIVETVLQKGSLSTGKIIYSQSGQLFNLSAKDSIIRPFLTTLIHRYAGDFHVSPDHKWVAFNASIYDQQGNYIGQEIDLTTSDERDLKTITWNNPWHLTIDGWLDNDRFILSPKPSTPHGTILLYNPFTRQQQQIEPTFPDIFNNLLYKSPGWNSEQVLYDPTLKRVIYLSSKDIFTIILWNLHTSREIWRLSDPLMPNLQPVWSPDGSYFIFAAPLQDGSGNFEFHKVSKDGIENRLIDQNFHMTYDAPFVLSPDGQHLALIQIQPNSQQHLLLVNLTSKEITDYCISASVIFIPIWSPDSKQLTMLLEGANSPLPQIPRFNIILDISANKVILINERIFPKGWLSETP